MTNRIRTTGALAFAATLVVSLAACSGGAAKMTESSYVSEVKKIATFPDIPDEQIVELGQEVCTELDKEGSAESRNLMLEEFVASVANANGSMADAKRFVDLSTKTFCVGYSSN